MTNLPVPVWATTLVPGGYDTAALMNTVGVNGTFLTNPPIATLMQTAATQTLTTITWTTITWDSTASVDTYGGYVSGTSTSKYTAQVAGTYRVRGLVNFANNATGIRAAKIAKNGAPILGAQGRYAAASATGTTAICEWPVPMSVGDYVELLGYQSSGGNLATAVDAETCSSLLVQWLHA